MIRITAVGIKDFTDGDRLSSMPIIIVMGCIKGKQIFSIKIKNPRSASCIMKQCYGGWFGFISV
jgi:hypothetical protein